MLQLSITATANSAIRNYTQWRFRYKRSQQQDAVYVETYAKSIDDLEWSTVSFVAMPGTAFESFKLHFPLADFIEVPQDQPLIDKVIV
ncbi:MAG: hypothetical protein KGL39_41155 [Patescibacteria group bacterium]|nr:hypothetical protein [Patescibacteria group bacterium]